MMDTIIFLHFLIKGSVFEVACGELKIDLFHDLSV